MTDIAASTTTRSTWDWNRNGAIAGILAVVLWVVAFLVLGDVTNKDEATKILASYKDHDDKILLGSFLFLLGVAVFFFFLGALRNRLLAAEGPAGQLTAIAYGAGVAVATLLALFPGPDMAGALNHKHLDESAANAMHKLSDGFFIAAEYVLPVLLVATGLLALRNRIFPAWLAWLSLVIALVLLIGPIGWAALIFAFPVWVLIVSVLLWRGAGAAATAV